MLKTDAVVSSIGGMPDRCPSSGWRGQFARPRGWAGKLAGHVMAWKNDEQNRFAVDQLEIETGDRVLEIGFGSGRALRAIAGQAALTVGIDHSEVMLVQAARRNRDLITSGRMQLEHGTVAALPFTYAQFDKVLAVNCFHLWPNQELNLVEVQRVMKARGRLIICQRMDPPAGRRPLAPGITEDDRELIEGLLRWVGFVNIRSVRQRCGREIVCIVAER